jgi:hypothetical protein
MGLTNVDLDRIDGSSGSISTASINNIKNAASVSNNIVLNADGTTTLTPNNIIKSGTAVASTSGTSIDFTGIPSWVKRITVMFNGVSLSGSASFLIQIGSGSFTTSGYSSRSVAPGSSATATTTSTSGFACVFGDPSNTLWGTIYLLNVNSNNWISNHLFGSTDGTSTYSIVGGGSLSLSGALDRVRITSTSTDTFDAGTVNLLWEG